MAQLRGVGGREGGREAGGSVGQHWKFSCEEGAPSHCVLLGVVFPCTPATNLVMDEKMTYCSHQTNLEFYGRTLIVCLCE